MAPVAPRSRTPVEPRAAITSMVPSWNRELIDVPHHAVVQADLRAARTLRPGATAASVDVG
jgi:hypothetical protein